MGYIKETADVVKDSLKGVSNKKKFKKLVDNMIFAIETKTEWAAMIGVSVINLSVMLRGCDPSFPRMLFERYPDILFVIAMPYRSGNPSYEFVTPPAGIAVENAITVGGSYSCRPFVRMPGDDISREAAEIRAPKPEPVEPLQASIERRRETSAALWQTNDYKTITCKCGTRLRIPPKLQNSSVRCPHCGRSNST